MKLWSYTEITGKLSKLVSTVTLAFHPWHLNCPFGGISVRTCLRWGSSSFWYFLPCTEFCAFGSNCRSWLGILKIKAHFWPVANLLVYFFVCVSHKDSFFIIGEGAFYRGRRTRAQFLKTLSSVQTTVIHVETLVGVGGFGVEEGRKRPGSCFLTQVFWPRGKSQHL